MIEVYFLQIEQTIREFPNVRYLSGLPPYINTKKLTKPLLQVASKKKLKRGYWVHFLLECVRTSGFCVQ